MSFSYDRAKFKDEYGTNRVHVTDFVQCSGISSLTFRFSQCNVYVPMSLLFLNTFPSFRGISPSPTHYTDLFTPESVRTSINYKGHRDVPCRHSPSVETSVFTVFQLSFYTNYLTPKHLPVFLTDLLLFDLIVVLLESMELWVSVVSLFFDTSRLFDFI